MTETEQTPTLPERGKGYDLASRPLLHEIDGSRSYQLDLQKASVDLYDRLRTNPDVKANIGKPVIVDDKQRTALPAFPSGSRTVNLGMMEHLLHSLSYFASHLSERVKYIGVPLNQKSYRRSGRYSHLGLRAAQRVVYGLHILKLEEEPFLEIVPGTFDRTQGQGQVTRVRASKPALDWLIQKGLIFPNHPFYPKQKYDFAYHLQIKRKVPRPRKAKQVKRPKDATEKEILHRPLHGTERILPTSLKLLKKARLSLPLPDYAFYENHWDWKERRSKLVGKRNARLFRSFSGKDGRGGRIYGHWVQLLPSEARKHLTFNRQPSVELDYSSMQLALLYHLHNTPMPEGELYEIPGTYWPREACKAVLRISVGSFSKIETVEALAKELLSMRLRAGKAGELYEAFWDRHDAVRPHTDGSSPAWVELQALDAQIALKVLCYLAEQEIPAVPIHDSFIVPAKYEAECREAMEKGFADYAPGISVAIKSTADTAIG
ncbi:hypothetical protein ACGYLO_20255 [Sulfitobacter sp. 1A13353]|uniref:hypothetical protein n=1 Tax=Sulfitobacter sp. 1A13353 TaxID=3368568 RepID=UPI0037465878